jgi:hypothetical protein
MIEQTVNAVCIFVMAIEAELIPHRKKDQQTAREAQSKPGNVDQSKIPVTAQVSKGSNKIVFDHGLGELSAHWLSQVYFIFLNTIK